MSLGVIPCYKTCYGYYELISDGTDLSGNSRTADDGTGTPTFTYPGRYHPTSLYIDAAENMAYTGGAVNTDGSDFSMGGWFLSAHTPANAEIHTVVCNAANSGGFEICMIGLSYLTAGTTLRAAIRSGGNDFTYVTLLTDSTAIAAWTAQWHLYGVSSDMANELVYFYIDGVPIHPNGLAADTGASSVTAFYNGGYMGVNYPGHGHICNTWNRAELYTPAWWRKFYAWSIGKMD